MKNAALYKGSLQTIVLKLLLDNKRMYGYEITQMVKKITSDEIIITEGALYPCLHKLEAEGFLEVEVEKVGNRIRKHYKLSESGINETNNKMADFIDFIENMCQLTQIKIT